MLLEMYPTLLTVHGFWRWVVLLAALAAVGGAAVGLAGGRPFASPGRRLGVIYVAALDLQFLVGLVLYFISPIVQAAWSNMAVAMKNADLRFFAVEHLVFMLLAVALAHVGSVRSRRAADDRTAYRRMLAWNLASLAVMIAGIPWASRPLLRGLGI